MRLLTIAFLIVLGGFLFVADGSLAKDYPFFCCKDQKLNNCQKFNITADENVVRSSAAETKKVTDEMQNRCGARWECGQIQDVWNGPDLYWYCVDAAGSVSGQGLYKKDIGDLRSDAERELNRARLGSPQELINRIIKFLMYPIGAVTLVLYIWAGFLWMMAAGNAERVESAKKILVWTTLGVIVILASYILVELVFNVVS